MLKKLHPEPKLTHSPYILHLYGNSKPLKPLGKVQLLCEQQDHYQPLVFQMLPDHPNQLCFQAGIVNILG